ncbi:hypothetical protein [Chitinimonas naiadis]
MRSAQWEDIQQRLISSSRHTKKDLKIFERFFLKGKDPYVDRIGADPIPLIYRLWFSPDQSDEAWRKIVDEVFSYHPWQTHLSLDETDKVIRDELSSSKYCGKEGYPLGFMGGLERRMFEFLGVDSSTGQFISFEGRRIIHPQVFNIPYYLDLIGWLRGDEYVNPYNFSLYSHEFWYAALSDEFCERIVQKEWQPSVTEYFGLVLRHVRTPGLPESEQREYCRLVFSMIENRPVPGMIKTWWEQEKQRMELEPAM